LPESIARLRWSLAPPKACTLAHRSLPLERIQNDDRLVSILAAFLTPRPWRSTIGPAILDISRSGHLLVDGSTCGHTRWEDCLPRDIRGFNIDRDVNREVTAQDKCGLVGGDPCSGVRQTPERWRYVPGAYGGG